MHTQSGPLRLSLTNAKLEAPFLSGGRERLTKPPTAIPAQRSRVVAGTTLPTEMESSAWQGILAAPEEWGQTIGESRTRYLLHLSLTLRGERLTGGLAALSLPGKRVGNALTSRAELKREERLSGNWGKQ